MTRRSLPSIPGGFRGELLDASEATAPWAGAAGPYRHRPRGVALPRDGEDVSHLVRWAGAEGVALVPRGGGTGMPGGNVGGGVVVDLSRHLDRLGPLERDPPRIRAEAGVTATRVQEAARERGLFLPPLPSSAERCTVGGMVANNAAGARSFRYGSVRDWVLELEVVLADGSWHRLAPDRPPPDVFRGLLERLTADARPLLEEWPRVRKNSSGYLLDRFLPTGDAAQLLVGSEGTLGVVTAVTFRLAPEPRDHALLLLPVADRESLLEAVSAAERVGASACEFLGRPYLRLADPDALPAEAVAGDPWALLLVEVEAAGEAADDRLREVAEAGGGGGLTASDPAGRERIWAVRHAASPVIARKAAEGLRSMQFVEDCVVPPGRLGDFLVRLEEILSEARLEAVVFGHAGDANVHVNPLVPVGEAGWRSRVRQVLDRTVELVADLGGTLAGEHGDGRLRAPLLDRIWSRRHVDAFRGVKSRLDPAGVLNPGVVLPLPGQDPLADLGHLRDPAVDRAGDPQG